MNDIDREDTKPIKVLSDIDTEPITRSSKNADLDNEATTSRIEKYKDIEEENVDVSEEEQAEEALAEKNINEAEAILEEEAKDNKEVSEENKDDKKEKGIKKLITKFKALPKKKKIAIIVAGIIVLILIIASIVLLVTKNKKDEVSTDTEEEAPVIVDNFYYKDGYLYFLDENEKEIGSYECANKDSDLCYVAYNNYRDNFNSYVMVDEDGEEIKQRMPIYNDNYVFITDNSDENSTNVVMYSIDSGKEIDTYSSVKAYDDNYIVYADMSKQYGLMKIEDDSYTELIKPSFNYIGMIDGKESLVAQNSKGYIIIDEKGKEKSSALASNYEIKDYSDSLIVALVGGEYNVYNYSGTLVAGGFTYASVVDDYMALVDSSNKLYIRDKDNNKLMEDGLALKNKDYLKTLVYDEDNKLDETRISYTVELKDDSVSVGIYPSDYKDPIYSSYEYNIVNTNKNYKLMNYFSGNLYFYKDDAKTELIGKYTCNNKNTIGNNNELNSCYVAKESIYEDNESYTTTRKDSNYIPMIYNKYVFISDGNGTVVLYDLVNSKTLGTYESVSSYVDYTDGSFVNVNKDITFTALNKKGKYGMVNLTESGASAKVKFDYNKIEKFGTSYLLVQNSENKWQLMYGSADNTSVSYDGKIQEVTSDKSYFKVSSGSNYVIYNTSGAKAINSTFKYAKMYPTYVVGVDTDNNLYVYDYNGNKLTNEAIKVSGTSCGVGEYATASVSGSSYTIKYCSDGSSYITKTIDTASKSSTSDEE